MYAAFPTQDLDVDMDQDLAINLITAPDPSQNLSAEETRNMLSTTNPSMLLKKDTFLERNKTTCTNTRNTTEATQNAALT